MISNRFLSFLVILALCCSFFVFRPGVTPISTVSSLTMAWEEAPQSSPLPDPELPHQLVPASILVYTEHTDLAPGGE